MPSKIYLSIGVNCGPRIYIKSTLQLTKEKGYKSCPFDLCITSYAALYECLKTDFKYFFDDLHLIPWENAPGDRSLCGKGGYNIMNKYGINFNHEGSTHSHMFNEGKNDDKFYIRNDFQEFRKRYQIRVKNWFDYIEQNDEIILVHGLHKVFKGEGSLQAICDLLKGKYPKKIFRYLEI